MKTLIKYSDWLMLTRGKIEPRIGDKIIFVEEAELKKGEIRQIEIDWFHINNQKLPDYYVEVPYPEIKWVDNELFVGNQIVYKIFWTPNEYELHSIEGIIFKGTLEECKTKANELLWKL